MQSNISKPFVVPPNSGKVLKLVGVTHKLISQQTGGSYYLFESEFDPESGNGLHVHTYEDEVVYVVQGAILIRLGDGKLEAAEGSVAHLPKGIPHALYNPLKTPLRILALAIPGGMEQYFDELESTLQDGSMDDAKHKEISRKYGIEWLE
ncbi:MAG: cupin domain-containing protein [Chloroflexi bacterium]|nr:cupin domain-containing protein [Chloroflexota bacterium]